MGVVTKPFDFEGKPRARSAQKGLDALREAVDTLIVIPNQRLLGIASKNMTLLEAFREADNVLYNAVKGVSDLITIPGLINVDFADVRTIMASQGMALMGAGISSGEGRASKAAQQAISSPLLEDTSIDGARGILVNITGGETLTLMEVNEASTLIQEAAHPEANIIWGAVIDQSMGDDLHITVVATGFDRQDEEEALPAEAQEMVPEAAREAGLSAGPPDLPPLGEYEEQRPFVTVVKGGAASQGAGAEKPPRREKPWTRGGLSFGELSGGRGRKRSPFSTPADSEFGQGGYPFKKRR